MRSQHFPDIDERAFEASWDLIYRYSATPEVTAEGAEKSFRLKKVVWGQEANFPAEQVIDNKFVQKAKEQLGWR
ncbi:MAG: hypothetical protein HYX89_08615 [Chloroflexi bacterium]|nr:hypothetical protein [Chloroflexota bacterium]